MEKTLTSIQDMHRQGNGAYFGDSPDWLVVYSVHRDSDVLERANFEAFRRILAELSPENEEWTIEESGHWLVGWVRHLTVLPDSTCHAKALDVLERYEGYPVIDEQLYSDMEWEEVIENCGLAFQDWYYAQRGWNPAIFDFEAEVGSYIAGYASDIGEDVREEYWPDKQAIFFGYLAYRRAAKTNLNPRSEES